jgi:hypothetical protein
MNKKVRWNTEKNKKGENYAKFRITLFRVSK